AAGTSPPTPSATTSGALGAVTMHVTRTTVPAEFRYVVLGGGEEFRLVVLDLNAGRAAQVATARIALPSGAPTGPSAAVAASKDGLIGLVPGQRSPRIRYWARRERMAGDGDLGVIQGGTD